MFMVMVLELIMVIAMIDEDDGAWRPQRLCNWHGDLHVAKMRFDISVAKVLLLTRYCYYDHYPRSQRSKLVQVAEYLGIDETGWQARAMQ